MRVLAGALALWICLAATAAQDPQPADPTREALPQIDRQRRGGGPRLLHFPDAGETHFRLLALVAAGVRFEPDDMPGIARFTQRILRRNSGDRSWQELEAELAAELAQVRHSCGSELVLFAVQIPRQSWRLAVRWLCAVLTHRDHDQKDIDAVAELLAMDTGAGSRDSTRIADARARALYGDHDLGKPHQLEAQALARIDRIDLLRFLDAWYRSNRCLVAFSGSPDVEDTMRQLHEGLGRLQPMQLPDRDGPAPSPRYGAIPAPELSAGGASLSYDGGYHIHATLPDDLLHLALIQRHLHFVLRDDTLQVEQFNYADTQRLEFFAAVPDRQGFEAVHARIGQLARACHELSDPDFTRARQALLAELRVASLDELDRAARLAYYFEALAGSASQLPAAIQALAPERTGAFAAARLGEAQRFWVAAPEATAQRGWWYLCAGLLLLFCIDGFRGFALLRRFRPQRPEPPPDREPPALPEPEPPPAKVSGDDLEASIQRWFAEEDRRGDD